MPEITLKQSKEFFENINSKDNIIVIHHDDVDGFASGLLFYEFCKNKNANVSSIPFELGSDQENIVKQTRKANKIILSDLAPNTIQTILEKIKNKEVFYTDHHPKDVDIPKEILEYRTTGGYIPSSRSAFEIVGGKYWLAVAGVLADMGHLDEVNKPFLDNFFIKRKIQLKRYEHDIVHTLNKFLIYFHQRKKKAFKILSKVKDYKEIKQFKKYARPVEIEIQKHIKNYKTKKEKLGILNFYIFNPKYPIKSTVSTKISFENPSEAYVFAKPNGNIIKLSARCQNKKLNMADVLKAGIKGLKNAGAGGHVPAAGGHIEKKDLDKFKENLKNYNPQRK